MMTSETTNGSNNGNGNGNGKSETLTFYSHSQIFYYWPVWVTALGLGVVSEFFNGGLGEAMAGPFMVFVLLYVIIATGVSMRGLWFILISLLLVIAGFVAHLSGVVDDLLLFLTGLDLKFSTDVYWAFGLPLFAVWLLTTFIYDRLRYVQVSRGNLVMVREVGDGEDGYDTIGMNFQKRRDNFAQHSILGLGSGDLIITPREGDPIRIPNVLRISRKMAQMKNISNGGRLNG